MPKQKIDLTLPASLKYSSLIRQIAEEIFSSIGFTQEWTNRLKLVVDELFMNANRYGSAKDQGKIYISFIFNETEVNFQIDDEGLGDNRISAKELQKIINQNKETLKDITKTSGRGLALISSLWTDELTITESEYGGISVTFKKNITNEAPPPPPTIAVAPAQAPTAPIKKPAAPEEISPVAPAGPTETVPLEGQIDPSNMDEKIKPIEAKVSELPENSVLILDCEKLVYINSTFIGHLAAWHNEMQKKNGQLALKNTNDQIKDVLKLVGLSRVIYVENK